MRLVLADVTQRSGPQQRVTQRMQQHIAIGMSDQPALMRDAHSAEHDMIAVTKAVNIVTVTDSHHLPISLLV